MKSLKLIFVFLVTFLRRKFKIIGSLFLILIFLSVLTFYWNQAYSKPNLVEGIVGTHQEHDLPEVVTNLLSQSLVVMDKSGIPKPNLIKQWEVDKEAKKYTLTLKDNLYWTDGTKVISSDISIPIPDIKISYPNDKTITLDIGSSFSPFPTLLTKPIFKKDSKIGLGPYKITNIQKDQIFIKRLVLISDDKSMPEVTVKFYPNEKIAKNALSLGEVSTILNVNEPTDLKNDKTLVTLSKTNYRQLVTIFYNTKDPILSDENMRLVLSFASPAIKDEVEAKTSIPPTSWAFNDEVKDYLDNFEQAQAYLEKVQKGKDELIILTATSSLKSIGEAVIDAWNRQGLKAVLRVESGVPQNFQALLIAHNIPSDPDQYSLWHSTQKDTNISKLSDSKASPRIDKDLEDGRKSMDVEVRKAKYKDFQKVLLDVSPATFLYFPKYNIIFRKKVETKINKIINLQLPYLH